MIPKIWKASLPGKCGKASSRSRVSTYAGPKRSDLSWPIVASNLVIEVGDPFAMGLSKPAPGLLEVTRTRAGTECAEARGAFLPDGRPTSSPFICGICGSTITARSDHVGGPQPVCAISGGVDRTGRRL
jgi:hypothetical protein